MGTLDASVSRWGNAEESPSLVARQGCSTKCWVGADDEVSLRGGRPRGVDSREGVHHGCSDEDEAKSTSDAARDAWQSVTPFKLAWRDICLHSAWPVAEPWPHVCYFSTQ